MTRRFYIERLLRQVSGGMPSDDSQLTFNLANGYLNEAIAVAAKQCYKESMSIDGVAYVNNAFYVTFKNLPIVAEAAFTWKFTLPAMPIGLGMNDGISNVRLKDNKGVLSQPLIAVNANQTQYKNSLKWPQNKMGYWNEGKDIFIESLLPLAAYKGQVRMVSGGLSTDLDSEINVPDDYMPIINEYMKKQLSEERAQKQDLNNDGQDAV
jgi:hypothetical protein